MKLFFLLSLCSICIWMFISSPGKNRIAQGLTAAEKDPVNFETQVLPILQHNCSPCHFPGGKLHDKLPFDKGITIVNNEQGIAKRLKKIEELNIIRQYVAQNKNTPTYIKQ